MLTNEGISTAFRAMKAPRRATAPGTARKPAARKAASSQPANLEGTLSHHGPGALASPIRALSLRRNDSSTAFLAHCRTVQAPSIFSATRRSPQSSAPRVASTASRSAPLVVAFRLSRRSQAASMAASSWAWSVMAGISSVVAQLRRLQEARQVRGAVVDEIGGGGGRVRAHQHRGHAEA